MDVEKKLNDYIADKCIKIQPLAEKAGVPYQTLYRCLKGLQELKASEFLAVCVVLEVDPKTFLTE